MVPYNRSRQYSTSTFTRLIESQEAHGRTQEELTKALSHIKYLEAEVARLERELASRG